MLLGIDLQLSDVVLEFLDTSGEQPVFLHHLLSHAGGILEVVFAILDAVLKLSDLMVLHPALFFQPLHFFKVSHDPVISHASFYYVQNLIELVGVIVGYFADDLVGLILQQSGYLFLFLKEVFIILKFHSCVRKHFTALFHLKLSQLRPFLQHPVVFLEKSLLVCQSFFYLFLLPFKVLLQISQFFIFVFN